MRNMLPCNKNTIRMTTKFLSNYENCITTYIMFDINTKDNIDLKIQKKSLKSLSSHACC